MDRNRPAVLAHLRDLTQGPPFALPERLDDLAERFGRLGPRARVLVAATGVLASALVLLAVSGDPYGPTVEVATVTRTVPAGTTLTPADLTTTRWPERLLPPRLVTDPVGRTALRSLTSGQPVPADAVATEGVAALLVRPDGVAYPLPADVAPDAAVGAYLDLLGTRPSGDGVRLASAARVLARAGDVLWCEVGRDEAPALAGATTFGRLVAVVLPPTLRPTPPGPREAP